MEKKIIIVGLGAGDIEQLPLGVYRLLQRDLKKFVRTKEHPVITDLENEGTDFKSFDDIYEAYDQFEEVYEEITNRLIEVVGDGSPIIYAVPGHPLVAESTVQRLLQRERNGEVVLEIIGGQSFLDPIFASLRLDPIDGFQLLDGTNIQRQSIQIQQHIIIAQVYDAFVASEVKLTLMEKLPDDYTIHVITAAGSSDESIQSIPLYELDRVAELSNLTAVYVPPVKEETQLYREFEKLREVIATLRGPDGCPWDKKQTHTTLKKYLIEECYEVLEAIDEGDELHLVEELGDVLLQVLLHAQIGEDDGLFTIEDVIGGLTEKMIRRHPHVFGETNAEDSDQVIAQWEAIKKEEKKTDESDISFNSILSSIPGALPSLLKAYKLQKKAANVGFDWGEEGPIWEKLQEELDEWMYEIKEGNKEEAEKELGDVLFVFVNLARFHGIDPEEALRMTNNKFMRRFEYIERIIVERGEKIEEQTLKTLDSLWDEAKAFGL